MTRAIEVTGLTRRYRDHVALDDVHLTIEAGTITGLLGRNGAGKTTLLRVLAGQEFPSAGTVRIFGASPVDDADVLHRMLLVREDQLYPDFQVRHALRAASWCYPNWDASLASSLLEEFGVRPRKAVKGLSRGMRSALGIVLGIAARAELTLFDEPYAGLDAVARQIFYDRLAGRCSPSCRCSLNSCRPRCPRRGRRTPTGRSPWTCCARRSPTAASPSPNWTSGSRRPCRPGRFGTWRP
jgi:ABC-2 type transport system ATP-binding protein